jgi:hypothetical protein
MLYQQGRPIGMPGRRGPAFRRPAPRWIRGWRLMQFTVAGAKAEDALGLTPNCGGCVVTRDRSRPNVDRLSESGI